MCNKRTTSQSTRADHTNIKCRPLRYQSRHTTEPFFIYCHPHACLLVRSLCQQLFLMSDASLFVERSCIATASMSHIQTISVRTLETHICLPCLFQLYVHRGEYVRGRMEYKGSKPNFMKKSPLKKLTD